MNGRDIVQLKLALDHPRLQRILHFQSLVFENESRNE